MIKSWDDEAWDDYLYWQTQDKRTLKRINDLLKDIDRNGYAFRIFNLTGSNALAPHVPS